LKSSVPPVEAFVRDGWKTHGRELIRPTIIAGNWKHNPKRSAGESLWRDVSGGVEDRRSTSGVDRQQLEVLIFPPMPWLGWIAAQAADAAAVGWGAQSVSECGPGAFTGEVGAQLVNDFGAQWCLVGHSERRTLFGVDDRSAARRVRQALDHDLKPVLCIGETLEQREGGETRQVVAEQLKQGLSLCEEGEFPVVAYEPVWAIGTGVTATVEQVAEVHGFLRNHLCELRGEGAQATPILYGGSVKAANAADLLGLDDVDGALVGGASLEAESFLGIVDAGFACCSGRRPETS
jgi:triosephosphate isomerase